MLQMDLKQYEQSDLYRIRHTAAAYWRGDEQRPMMQRIYGTAWPGKKELKCHLQLQEEAKRRDHRKLGRDLEIFIMDEEVGPGLPLWLPNGNILREELEKLAHEVESKDGWEQDKPGANGIVISGCSLYLSWNQS